MKKQIILAVSVLVVILAFVGCNNAETVEPTETPAQNQEIEVTGIDGRIIEIVDDESITIRNEVDTTIYFKIDIKNITTTFSCKLNISFNIFINLALINRTHSNRSMRDI